MITAELPNRKPSFVYGASHAAGSFYIAMKSMRSEAPEAQRAFYHSKAWQRCRTEYISKVGGLCERCYARGVVRPGYIVHHKEYIDLSNINDPSVLLNHDNLEYLCMDCHNAEHFKSTKRYKVDEFGRIETK